MDPADKAGDAQRNGKHAPMPPVSSQPFRAVPHMSEAHMAPPFTAQPAHAAAQPHEPAEEPEPTDELPQAWETGQEEGSAEPVFEADVTDMEAALGLLGDARQHEEDFPLDAFIIPEEATHVPTGVDADEIREEPPRTPASELAERLEKLSHRLRVEDTNAVLARLAGGDKLDAMLAGLLAGYLAGNR